MQKKIYIFSILAAIILVLTFFPTQPVSSTALNKNNTINDSYNERSIGRDSIKMKVLHIKEDGTYDSSIKELTSAENKALRDEMRHIEKQSLPVKEMFEKKLEILKKYDLVPNDLALKDILDINKLEGMNRAQDEDEFEAEYAAILFVGGGFGFGFGLPFFITSGTFLVALFGFGLVYAYDIFNGISHQLMTLFFIPMLVGYLGGFIGLLLLPVVPGFFYSNILGLGYVAKTHWMYVPSMNISAV